MEIRFLVIGAGMSGILAAIKLREAGFENIVVLEKAGKVGGTWRENRYPGLTCDVPAHAYTYSFAPNPEWSAYYAKGAEIQTYFENVVRDHGIGHLIHFGSEVTACEWLGGEWKITTSTAEVYHADVVVVASGVLHHPHYPEIAGMNAFAGKICHSARWDDSIVTDGMRVGVVGTGSTGVQIVSAIARGAETVSHFQRSPQWIMPVKQAPYSDEEREAFRNNPELIDAIRYDPEYEGNVRRFTTGVADHATSEMQAIEKLCLDNLEQSVADPLLRKKLRPKYRAGCKRLIYSWEYYDVIQRHSVDVVVDGIKQIEAEGIRTVDGKLHPLDVIILATGFCADRFIRPAVVTGRDGKTLDSLWVKRPTAYYAISVPDFPNLFFMNGPTSPVGNFSLIDVAERQWGYISQLIAEIVEGRCREISPTHEAMKKFDVSRIEAARKTIFSSGCRSWYLDSDGIPITWPWGYDAFAEAMKKPTWDDFERRTE